MNRDTFLHRFKSLGMCGQLQVYWNYSWPLPPKQCYYRTVISCWVKGTWTGQGRSKDNYDLSYGPYSTLVQACVLPILDYGCAVWNVGGNFTKLDSIQHRSLRFFCGLPRTTPILSLVVDSGWKPGIIRRDLDTLRLYNQIVRRPSSRITRTIYEFDRDFNGEGKWTKNLRHLCKTLGKLDNWMENRPINLKFAEKKLMEMYEEVWKDELIHKSKLNFYRSTSPHFCAASHL